MPSRRCEPVLNTVLAYLHNFYTWCVVIVYSDCSLFYFSHHCRALGYYCHTGIAGSYLQSKWKPLKCLWYNPSAACLTFAIPISVVRSAIIVTNESVVRGICEIQSPENVFGKTDLNSWKLCKHKIRHDQVSWGVNSHVDMPNKSQMPHGNIL